MLCIGVGYAVEAYLFGSLDCVVREGLVSCFLVSQVEE